MSVVQMNHVPNDVIAPVGRQISPNCAAVRNEDQSRELYALFVRS